MKMMMLRLFYVLAVIACASTPVSSKSSAELAEDAWIVVLDDPPMMHFEGFAGVQSKSDDKRAGLAATAPAVTGAARLDVHTPAARAYSAYLRTRRETVLSEAAVILGRGVEPVHRYEILSNGFSLRADRAEAQALARLPGVARVLPVEIHRTMLDAGPGRIGADRLWDGDVDDTPYRGEGQVIGVIDSGINWNSVYFSDQVPGYTFTNPYGEGLGECSLSQVRCNEKLVGVYDFTDEGTFGEDSDGHGSHVASIAAGNPVDTPLAATSGVAPRAHIISYKVCLPDEDGGPATCVSDAILAALEQAVADQVDVVNYSIGSGPVNPWTSPSAQAFLTLYEAGIVAVSSAGNDGPVAGSAGSPANAPWVIAVGNSTHGRLFGNRLDAAGLDNLASVLGNGPAPTGNISAQIVDAEQIQAGNALGCEPFPGGTLAGAIALIRRGDCLFRDKVDHAEAAGAVAVVVFNDVFEAPFVMDMQGGTTIPAAMISLENGLAVQAALVAGAAPAATLQAETSAIADESLADVMAASSSRGPNLPVPGVMKPNVTAPGSDILGAGRDQANAFARLTGTSMASPHVAGASALLLQARPDWTPAMVASALETTAMRDGMRDHDGGRADINARGAGRVQVDSAADIGLYLDIDANQFRAAEDHPETLNLSGVVAGQCRPQCVLTRRLTALHSGSWTVETAGEVDIEVSPGAFTLDAGEAVELQITLAIPENIAGPRWAGGAIDLLPESSQFVAQTLTVGVETPAILDIVSDSNRGRVQMQLPGLDPLAEAVVTSTPLVATEITTRSLAADPDPDDPYDGDEGTFVVWLDVPEDAALLHAETLPSAARDVDLFVGLDSGDSGRPSEADEQCSGTSPDDLEVCLIAHPDAGRWWVLVQNWSGSTATGSDEISARIAVVPGDDDESLSAAADGVHGGGLLPLRLSWDQPALLSDETWMGAVTVHDAAGPAGVTQLLPVSLRRDFESIPQHTALVPNDDPLPVVVPANGMHDRLFVDIPESVTSLAIFTDDQDVRLSLAYLDFSGIEGFEPDTPPAPDNIVAVGETSQTGTIVDLEDADLVPGRYYVVVENEASGERLIGIEAQISTTPPVTVLPPPLPQPRIGLWSPRNRGTGQGIAWDRAGWGFITWYTYEEDGSPVFYLAAAPVDPASPVWSAPLDRYTSTDDERQHLERVGRVMLTTLAEDDVIFSWRLYGAHGSERMRSLTAAECRDGQSLTGLWVVPGKTLGGITTVVNPQARAYIRYFYDALGLPRWLITGDELGDDVLQALEPEGWCPYCRATDSMLTEVGTYQIRFSGEDRAREIMEARLGNGFELSLDHEIEKFSERKECL